MAELTLTSAHNTNVTILSNNFIDFYMCNANGEFVKVYLYLVRCTQNMPKNFSLGLIADCMNMTEGDVLRALHYWEQQKLIELSLDNRNTIRSIAMLQPEIVQPVIETAAVHPASHQVQATGETAVTTTVSHETEVNATPPIRKAENSTPLIRKAESEVLQELALITEQYLRRQLTSMDLNKIAYFYEDLHFSPELIEYLLEHCVTNNNRSIKYIESVAIAWADKGITTVEQAMAEGSHYRREYFAILKAFGIHGRMPIDSEVDFMKKWLDEYHFTPEVIAEACQRTIANTGKPVFNYTDTILTNWKNQGILAKKDIVASDNAHQAKQQTKQANSLTPGHKVNGAQTRLATKFSNFQQRDSYDFDQLEKQLNST